MHHQNNAQARTMRQPRKPPAPDEKFLRIWYAALKAPVDMPADNKKVAIRIRWLLNQVRQIDKWLFAAKHGPQADWPLERMTTELLEREDGQYAVRVKKDNDVLGALSATGVIEEAPTIDPDVAWAACEERLMFYKNADFHKRAVTGRLTPDDIFPLPMRGDERE
jgi:hypothetical protein